MQETYLFRIFTEEYNNVRSITKRHVESATFITADGTYENDSEETVIIEISGGAAMREIADEIMTEINTRNNQTCCLLQVIQLRDETLFTARNNFYKEQTK